MCKNIRTFVLVVYVHGSVCIHAYVCMCYMNIQNYLCAFMLYMYVGTYVGRNIIVSMYLHISLHVYVVHF